MIIKLIVAQCWTFLLLLAFQQAALAQSLQLDGWVTDGEVMVVKEYNHKMYIGGRFQYIGPPTGSAAHLDVSTGKPKEAFPKANWAVKTIIPDGCGGWFLGGIFTLVGSETRKGIAHINAENEVSPLQVEIEGSVSALVIYQNTLLISGFFEKVNGENRQGLAQIDLQTGELLDLDLQMEKYHPTLGKTIMIHSLLVSGHKLYIGGQFWEVQKEKRTGLACIDLRTNTLTDWNPEINDPALPPGIDLQVKTMVHTGHSIFVGGYFTQVKGAERKNLAEVDTLTGHPTSFYYPFQPSSRGQVNALALKDDYLFAAGIFNDNRPSLGLRKIHSRTGAEKPFRNIMNPTNTLTLTDNILVLGGLGDSLQAFNLDDGTTLWKPHMKGNVLASAWDGTSLLVGGEFNSVGGEKRQNLAEWDMVTDQVTDWTCKVNFGVGMIYEFIKTIDFYQNTAFIGGRFTYAGDGEKRRNSIGQINLETGRFTEWKASILGDYWGVSLIRVADERVYVFGGFDYVHGGTLKSPGVAAFTLETGQLIDWGPQLSFGERWHPYRIQAAVAVGDKLYLAGSFSAAGGKARTGLMALEANSGKVLPWAPQVVGSSSFEPTFPAIHDLSYYNGSILISGEFTEVGGKPRQNFAAVDTLSGAPTNLVFDFDRPVLSFALVREIVYAAGSFTTVNGQIRPGLAALDLRRNTLSDWNPNNGLVPKIYWGYKYVEAVRNKLMVSGSWQQIAHSSNQNLAIFDLPPFAYNTIRGNIFEDVNQSCIREEGEPELANYFVKAEPGPVYASTDANGDYFLKVEPGTYKISQVLPSRMKLITKETCPLPDNSHTVMLEGEGDTAEGLNFGNKFDKTPLLAVDVSSGGRRRCFRSTTTVSYANEGYWPAQDVFIRVIYPAYTIPISSTLPVFSSQGKELVFSLGTLGPGERGTIVLTDSVMCGNESIRGLTQCVKAIIIPRVPHVEPPIAYWDNSSVAVSSTCGENGNVTFAVQNVGQEAMADSAQLRVFLNAELVHEENYRLEKEGRLEVEVLAKGRTARVETDQRPNHPGQSRPSATVEACEDTALESVSRGFVTQLPQDDQDDKVAFDCQQITDSYDPNDKQVFPSGVTERHLVRENTDLEYLIRFQNTGTDVAFTVVIEDELSEYLDLSTLRVGASSHPCTWKVTGQGRPTLIWSFRNINLPDSTRDEPGSHGFVKFKINQLPDLPHGTRITNSADIYFDFNSPITTNETFVTVGEIPKGPETKVAVMICGQGLFSPAEAGPDALVLAEGPVQLRAGVSQVGQGRWRLVSGQGEILEPENPASAVRNLGQGKNVFEWSVRLCEEISKDEVTLVYLAVPEVVAPAPYCAGETIQPLRATGSNLHWYADVNLKTLLGTGETFGPVVQATTTFYVTRRLGQFETPAFPVTMVIKPALAAPSVQSPSQICRGDESAFLAAAGTDVRWYADRKLTRLLAQGTAFAPAIFPFSLDSVFVTQTLDGCESLVTAVSVSLIPVPEAPAVEAPSSPVCEGGPLPLLRASGAQIRWYADEGMRQLLQTGPIFQPLASASTSFFVTQTVNGCESPVRSLRLTVTPAAVPVEVSGNTLIAPAADAYQWFYEGKALPGETRDRLLVRNTGAYLVSVHRGPCSFNSDLVVHRVVVPEPLLTLSPNPTDDHFTFEFASTEAGPVEVTITNALGQVVMQTGAYKATTILRQEIKIKGLKSGLYFVEVKTGDARVLKKLVKRQ